MPTPPPAVEAAAWTSLVGMIGLCWLWQLQLLEPLLGVLGAALACFGPIVALGIWTAVDATRRERAVALLSSAFSTPRRAWCFTSLLLLGAVKVYAVPGFRELDGDGACHTTAARLVADAFAAREWPTWSNAWAMGFPFLQFYPPLFAWLSGGLTALTHDPRASVRVVLAVAHLCSGWGAFALARRLFADPSAAVVAALGYALTPWHLFEVFHWNRFPTALVWALLPWVLWAFERERRGGRWAYGCGLLLATTALAHHGCALFVGQFLALWALLRWAEEPRSPRAELRELAVAGAFSVGLVAFFVLPYALESRLTFQPPGLGGVRFDFDQPHLATVLMPGRRPIGHSGYLGLTLVVPGFVGAVALAMRRGRARHAVVGCLAYAWLLALGHDLPFYRWVPFARTLFFGGRYLIFVALFLALGLGAAWTIARERGWWVHGAESTAAAIALVVLLVDLGGTTFTHYRYPFPGGRSGEGRREAFEGIRPAAGVDLATRVLELPEAPRDFLWSALLPLSARRATPAPGLWGTLRSGMYVFREWVDATRTWRDRRDPLAEAARDRLALAGTEVVLGRGRDAGASAETLATARPVPVTLGPMPGVVLAAPAWRPASPDLELPADGWERPFDVDSTPPGAVERIVSEMSIDRAASTARTLILRSPPTVELTGEGDAEPRVTVLGTTVTPTRFAVDLELSRGAYVRLAQSYYAHQRVRLDGKLVTAVPDVTYVTVLTVPAGRHRVELRGGWSPLRRAMGVASALVLVIGSAVEWRARRRAGARA